jgi:hypothetical protein
MSSNMEGGTAEQAREKGAELVSQAQQQVQETAQQAKSQVGDRLREQFDQRSNQAGEQVQAFADAMRRTSQQLHEDGNDGPARYAGQVAGYVERGGTYLTDKSADSIFADAEDFACRRPWMVAGGAVVVGLLASRFLKASGKRRHEQRSAPSSFDRSGEAYASYPRPRSQVDSDAYEMSGAYSAGAGTHERQGRSS